MKNKLIFILCFLCGGMVSCNEWLNVKPQTQVELEDMFETQQGFQDALTGAYLRMKNEDIYGNQLMYGYIEYLAQHWDIGSMSPALEKMSRYNYKDKDVERMFESIYRQLYTVIADVNAILGNIDGKEEVFENGMYNIIKGEALAIRAYCHFDVLRLFGPMPDKVYGGRILPYVKEVTIAYHDHHTYDEYVSFLKADLAEADSLLNVSDPVIAEHENLGISTAAAAFLGARQVRFNYYAVKALEARFYLWLGGVENKAKAYVCAKEVKEATDKDGKMLYTLGNTKSISNEDFSFSSEHIVAIYDYQLYSTANKNFKEGAVYAKAKNIVVPDLYLAGTTDIRYTGLWTEVTATNGAKSHVIKKYWQKDETGGINQLPLLRLSEMYFILMECGTLEEANELYDEFCISRDIPSVEIKMPEQLLNILVEEYNKEFYGEGQTFFAYKRLGVEEILWAVDPGNEEAYVVPMPSSEISYQN